MRAALLLLALTCAAAAAGADQTYRFDPPERLVAFGDVHGAYDALAKTLQSAGMIDAELHWRGGHAHLVSVGDLLDRGADSRKVLELLMRLESEASAAGGQVHVLFGNHEVMNLDGELRDTASAEFAAFVADETAAERQGALETWIARQAALGHSGDSVKAEFDTRFPPGWFAHRRAFAPDGRYGKWLLSHPVAIVVGDTAFAHAGFSRALAGFDLVRLNSEFHAGLSAYLEAVTALEQAGWIDFSVPGETRASVVDARLKAAGDKPDPALVAAARRVIDFDAAPLFGINGPVWYRGLALCHAVTETDVADAALAQFKVAHLAVGHTPTPSLRPTSRLGGRVLLMDTGMLKSTYGGRGHALEFSAAGVGAVDEDGAKVALTSDDRAFALPLPGGNEAALEALLREATIAQHSSAPGEREEVKLERGGAALLAWFYPDRKNNHGRELAAYRLDRQLGLGLVPTTVARNIDGVEGALQWRPDQIVGSTEAAGKRRAAPWCDGNTQLELMYVWDALLHNEGRTPASVNWEAKDWYLLSSDHRKAFDASTDMPSHLSGHKLAIGPELCRRLAALTKESVGTALEGAVDAKEQVSLLTRRDRITKQARCP
jgi:hypothetical protein